MDKKVSIQVSLDLFIGSIILEAREIRASNQIPVSLPDLISSNDQGCFIPTLQYALHESEVHQLKQKFLEYINTISSCQLDHDKAVIGDTSKMTWKSLAYIQNFLRTNSLERQAFYLYP